jgi:hypothetical protein
MRSITVVMMLLAVGCKASEQSSGSDQGHDAVVGDLAPPAIGPVVQDAAAPHASLPPDVHVEARADASVGHAAGSHAGSGGADGRDDDAGEAVAAHDAAVPNDATTPPSTQTTPVIVAAGANHTLYLSIDAGLTFCQVQRQVPANIGDGYDNVNLFRHISYANGRFVVGSAAKVFASVNGYAWQDVTGGDRPALGTYVAEIDFGNGYWVGVGASGTVMRSPDLAHWERPNATWPSANARSLVFGDGKFVASRDGSGWWSSTDGSAWQPFDTSQRGGVVFDGGQFIADPGYRHGSGIRVRAGNKTIERADDRDGAQYVTVATLQDSIADFAFGDVPAEDYAPGNVMRQELAACLGL